MLREEGGDFVRYACKMATGSGKTMVMGDARFSDVVLVLDHVLRADELCKFLQRLHRRRVSHASARRTLAEIERLLEQRKLEEIEEHRAQAPVEQLRIAEGDQ